MQTVTVRVTCDTGNSWVTRINTTFAEARRYFIGQKFTREDGDGTEKVDTVVQVDHLTAWNCPDCFPKICTHDRGE